MNQISSATQNIGSACTATKQLLQLPDTGLHRGAGPQGVEMQLAHAVAQSCPTSGPSSKDLQLNIDFESADLLEQIRGFGHVSTKQTANDIKVTSASPRQHMSHQRLHSGAPIPLNMTTPPPKSNKKNAAVENLMWQALSSMCDNETEDKTKFRTISESLSHAFDSSTVSTPKLELAQLSPASIRESSKARMTSPGSSKARVRSPCSDEKDTLSLSEYCRWRVKASTRSQCSEPLRKAFTLGLAMENISLPEKSHKRDRVSRSRSRSRSQEKTGDGLESAGVVAANKLSSGGLSDEPQRLQRIVNKLELLRKRY